VGGKMKLMKLALPLLVIFSLILITACDDRSMELPKYEIVKMEASPDTIYADNNITYSDIEVIVKDSEGFAVTNEQVTFSSTLGNVINNVYTDSAGVARSTFWDQGQMGTAYINAFVSNVTAVDTVYILDTPEITGLNLMVASQLNVDEITEIKASVVNATGSVPDGTIVTFTASQGFFSDIEGVDFGNTVQATTNNGIAKRYYNGGSQAGISQIIAMVGGVSDTTDVEIHPGSARYLYMFPDATEVEANSGQTVNILAQVEDKYHNPVKADVPVTFTTDLGNVTESASTNELGIAEAEFAPGIEAGIATIEAVADSATGSTVIDVISDDVSSISFITQDLVAIDVAGTGGNESAELRVALKDLSGNLVSDDYLVYFELIDYPAGVEINQPGTDDDSVMSVNGEAVVSIKSGTVAGNVKVRAYTFNEAGFEVTAEKSNIIVQAGAPTTVEYTFGGIDEAENIGGGLWRLQIAALVTDEWNNPVSNGTVVFFSIPDSIQYATIETGNAYVGNFNTDQDSIPGVAFSYLTFDGAHTNDVIAVTVVTGQITYSETFALPLQQGTLDVQGVPFHYEFLDNNQEYEDIELRILLKDGQANQINGQILAFETGAGYPIEPTPADTGDPFSGITGIGTEPPYTGQSGILYKDIRMPQIEFPDPNPNPVPVPVLITIKVLGTEVETSITVTITDMAAPPE